MTRMDREAFAESVREALETLPLQFREKLQNVEIVVEDWPDRETMRLAGVRNRAGLLGFYHGIPLPERTQGYNLVAPDKISIYRQPILLQGRGPRKVRETVLRVVRHEIAHYFGIDDERLREIGAY
jgi:predicted Zn-dependent protease with MMP-like domain